MREDDLSKATVFVQKIKNQDYEEKNETKETD